MNEFHTSFSNSQHVRLEYAILLYQASSGIGAATLNPVKCDRYGKFRIEPGTALDVEKMREIALTMCAGGKVNRSLTLFPPGLLAHGARRLIFFAPAIRRNIFFKVVDWGGKIRKKVIDWPPLVFDVSGRSLTVYALRTNERPVAETPLCIAPFPNVFGGSGTVCMPSLPPDLGCDPDQAGRWMDLFYDSPFSHAGGETVRQGGVMEFWHGVLKKRGASVDYRPILIDAKKTLGEIL